MKKMHLKLIKDLGKTNKFHKRLGLFLCDCGKEKEIVISSFRSGKSTSCGCGISRTVKHGNSRRGKVTREYNSWAAMIRRCEYKKSKDYKYYGGRGIIVCKKWRDSFQSFLNDMGEKPSEKHSIERINNDKNYEPKNCKWATAKEQGSNKRKTVEF